eukprot:1348896-Pyramimonas_sp.AAC.1
MPCGPRGTWGRFDLAKVGAAAAAVCVAQEATRPMLAASDQLAAAARAEAGMSCRSSSLDQALATSRR